MKRRKRRTDDEPVTFEVVQNPNAPRMDIGYARVSTAEQSLDMQVSALKRAGVTDAGMYVEKVSAASAKRPMLEQALASLRAGDTFTVWKMDRLARSLTDLLNRMKQIEGKGAGFKSLTEAIDTTTPAGRLIMHVLGAIGEFERDLIRERTRSGMAAAKAAGKQVGQPQVLSAADKKTAQLLRDRGWTLKRVAAKFCVSSGTIRNHTTGPSRSRRKS